MILNCKITLILILYILNNYILFADMNKCFDYVSIIEDTKIKYKIDIDTNLILAIMFVESSCNKGAINKKDHNKRGSYGLMQIQQKIYNPIINIKIGMLHLNRDIVYFKNIIYSIEAYNRGRYGMKKNPNNFPYYKKVIQIWKKYFR